jgi:hypothetical protein
VAVDPGKRLLGKATCGHSRARLRLVGTSVLRRPMAEASDQARPALGPVTSCGRSRRELLEMRS